MGLLDMDVGMGSTNHRSKTVVELQTGHRLSTLIA
jgi:hypothetical protein